MKDMISEFLQNDVGGVIVTDSDCNVLYSNNKISMSEKTKIKWSNSMPKTKIGQNAETWEFYNSESKKYYQVTTKSYLFNNKICQIHYLTDISEYTSVFKNISELSTSWERMSKFQTKILKKLSINYEEIFLDIAEVFIAEEIIFYVKSEFYANKITYNISKDSIIRSRIENEDNVFEQEESNHYDNHLCYINGKLDKLQYCMLIKTKDKSDSDTLNNIILRNAIRLFIENGLLKQQIIYESEHDSLTGLYNKRKYLSLLSENFGNPKSIAIYNMDVNNLKTVNDTYGHEMGDMLIKKAARTLLMLESECIYGFRIGGDEFIMIAYNISREKAAELKKNWEENISVLNKYDDNIPLVIACGMVYDDGEYCIDELLKKADMLMYQDKKAKKLLT